MPAPTASDSSSADAKAQLNGAIAPILAHLAGASVEDPAALKAQLDAAFPLTGPLVQQVRDMVIAGVDAGWLVPRENAGIRFGRLAKSTPASHDFVVDAVLMQGPGPGHTHPNGEVDLCFALDGAPQFDGNPAGWTVYGPGTWHVPTVSGDTMAILYFLPGGAIRFEPRPG